MTDEPPLTPQLTYELRDKTLASLKTHGSLKNFCTSHNLSIFALNYDPIQPSPSQNFPVGGLWSKVNKYWQLKYSQKKYSTPGFRALMGGVNDRFVFGFQNRSIRIFLKIKEKKKEFYPPQYCYVHNFPERVVQSNTNVMKIGPNEIQNS